MMQKAAFKFVAALFLILNLTSLSVLAADVPEPVGDIYIQDFAHLLTSEQKAELNGLGGKLEDGTTAQVAVLTIDSLEGESIEEFSNKAFRKYGIGSEEHNNGVLLVIALDDGYGEGKVRIEVGYGLEGALPDGKVGRILDEYTIPYLKNDQADRAIMETYKVLYNETAKEYGWSGTVVETTNFGESNETNPLFIIIIAVIVVIVVMLDMRFFGGILTQLLLSILFRGGRGGPGGNGGGSSRGGGGGSSGGGGASRGW